MTTKRVFRSGYCGLGSPPPMHGYCKGSNGKTGDGLKTCGCQCHQTPSPTQEPPMTTTAASATTPSSGTLQEFGDVIQGSDEWHGQRRGLITASVIGRLITPTLKPAQNIESRGLTALLAAERITGYTDPTFISDDMYRGMEDEPRAVEKYAEHYAPIVTTGFMVRDFSGFQIGYSPDGLVGDDGLVEVKSRRQKKQLQTILADQVPSENMAQLQCGLLVSGRQWIDYLSYCGGMPMWRKRVTPDPEWFEAIVAAAEKFEDNVADMVAAYTQATEGLPATERVDHTELGLVF